jgi:hypothetical protein
MFIGTRRIEIACFTIITSSIPTSRQCSIAALAIGFRMIRRNSRIRVRREQPSAHASRQHDGRCNGCFRFFHEFIVFVFILFHPALEVIQAQVAWGVNTPATAPKMKSPGRVG